MQNEQQNLEQLLRQNQADGKRPTLLLHSCCAPCSTYVLEYLAPHFAITVDYYNPNLDTAAEYAHRSQEQARLLGALPGCSDVALQVAPYAPGEFYAAVRGLEHLPEGSARCYACYKLRLQHTAALAKELGFAYFCTTLSISPHKNAAWLNEIGRALAAQYGVAWLPSDFKKKNGFKRSTQLAADYDLYRQDYCGCVFSKREAAQREAQRAAQE
jgi:predicted adenine nucleotide alpha hydrolase (AANH) superfamily ATPase